MAKGCVHIRVKDGKIQNVFCHLSDLPKDGVVHLLPDQVLTEDEFRGSHPEDKNELSVDGKQGIYDLGGDSV
jgi:hypothetical protein